jgi:hypothetical protein
MFSRLQLGLPLRIVAVLVRRESILAAFHAPPPAETVCHADFEVQSVWCGVVAFVRIGFIVRHFVGSFLRYAT